MQWRCTSRRASTLSIFILVAIMTAGIFQVTGAPTYVAGAQVGLAAKYECKLGGVDTVTFVTTTVLEVSGVEIKLKIDDNSGTSQGLYDVAYGGNVIWWYIAKQLNVGDPVHDGGNVFIVNETQFNYSFLDRTWTVTKLLYGHFNATFDSDTGLLLTWDYRNLMEPTDTITYTLVSITQAPSVDGMPPLLLGLTSVLVIAAIVLPILRKHRNIE